MTLRELLTGSTGAGDTGSSDGRSLSRALYGFCRANERDLWYVAIAAMLVDVTLTVHGLQLGLRELNPIARAALDTAGAVGLYALKSGAIAVALCCRLVVPPRHGAIVPLALAVPSLLAVAINATLITVVGL